MRLRSRAATAVGLVIAVVAAVLATAPAASAAARFTDVPADASYAADVQWLVDHGITRGTGPGRFSPTKPVTRQQMAVFLYKARNGGASPPGCRTAPYRDVPASSAYCGSIAWLKAQGITAGGARFDPTAPVTRGSMAVFVHKLGGGGAATPCAGRPAPDVAVSSSYCGSIAALVREGIAPLYSDGSFKPSKPATRGATATFLGRWYDVRHRPAALDHRGSDVSHPQCGTPLPAGQDFGIVGVNKGKPTIVNPCLAQQLAWAASSSNGTRQPTTQVYVNTANPGAVRHLTTTWPTSGTSKRYGACTGTNSEACAYQYGWNRAAEDVAFVRPLTAPETLTWWLDVEIDESNDGGNSWDRTKGGTSRNKAVLEGMTDHFRSVGIKRVGIYSTPRQWQVVTGTAVAADSSLRGLPNWLAGPSTIAEAQRLCSSPPLTPGGRVVLTQWTDVFDWNHACR